MYKNVISVVFTVCVLFCLAIPNSHAQSKNAFYVEFLGNGLLFSANYDMRFSDEPTGLGARVGIGYIGGADASVVTVPVMVNYLLGKDGRYFEIGGGATYVTGQVDVGAFGDGSSGSAIAGTLSFMYRRQPEDGGFMWKAGFTPILADGAFVPWWPGIAIGYTW